MVYYQGTMAFKACATAEDLRDVQLCVLWEWAVSESKPLDETVSIFVSTYRTFWPLLQLGDPHNQEDRMFECDERSILTILLKTEERYGKYKTGRCARSSLIKVSASNKTSLLARAA